MPYLKHLTDEEATNWVRKLFKKVEAGLGKMPVLFRAMANSEDVFEGFLNLNGALANTEIGPKLVKAVILRTSQLNDCHYCLCAHTQMAKDANLMTDEEILNARKGIGWDEKSQTMLDFVEKVVKNKGYVTQEDIDKMHKAGFSDKNIVEILGAIVVATMTNYLAHIADTPIDFPEVPPIE
ncbi:carboxymuconolactone decarboxylase family protein [bacterium]|nr:carboxymuconolactone decarboxylase family protein [bacterium]